MASPAALDYLPMMVVTEDNWGAARAAQLIPDHIDSFKSFQDWLKNLIKIEETTDNGDD